MVDQVMGVTGVSQRMQARPEKVEKVDRHENQGVKAWTAENHAGKSQEAAGHQKSQFKSLFDKTETAGQVASNVPSQMPPQSAGHAAPAGVGGQLDLAA